MLYNAKNVIVATGGFCRNADMIDEYMPDYSGVYTEVGVGCTGEGLRMGLDIGADYVGHGGTNGILACPVEPGQSADQQQGAVDHSGERFANEAGQTHDIYYDVAHFDDQKFFAVYDQAMVDALDDDLRSKFESPGAGHVRPGRHSGRSRGSARHRRRRSAGGARQVQRAGRCGRGVVQKKAGCSSRSRRLPTTC
ncbi:MAG: FAD-binding protein [Eggerthella lenta]